ncbi:hypothetical protein HC341_05790 [Aquisalimonas sp. 2447]|uniref:hypothetical protein n=1 Tax=Aquisalimonas sp. 2447 TaxID=2740807 RepID=UPI00143247FE|nr:hypothetical protein [Aquisalimonas sp. 2447]QIT54770.1 hypothetical protein HC341_05790 [Aquisalimonas sp. 2447]
MTGLLYVYCNNTETRRTSTGHGRAPEPRRSLMARVRHLLRTAFESQTPAPRH